MLFKLVSQKGHSTPKNPPRPSMKNNLKCICLRVLPSWKYKCNSNPFPLNRPTIKSKMVVITSNRSICPVLFVVEHLGLSISNPPFRERNISLNANLILLSVQSDFFAISLVANTNASLLVDFNFWAEEVFLMLQVARERRGRRRAGLEIWD